MRAAVRAEDGIVVAGEDLARDDVFFVLQTSGGTFDLPLPDRLTAEGRSWPVPLVRGDRLDGAVWLEGSLDQGLSVVGAVWNGAGWERTEVVSPAAAGRPQLAASGVVLDDGSWLVAWAAFDGSDDEILWSLRRRDGWTRPRRVHRDNRVPDVLPALTSEGSTTLLAWNFYDGNDYRVATARFDGNEWHRLEPLAGRGTDSTLWQKTGGRSFLTYRTVEPEAWTAVELDPSGEVLHQVTVPTAEFEPPAVELVGGVPRLTWRRGAGERVGR